MTVFDSVLTTPVVLRADQPFDEAQLGAVAFLARYRGRTLESYRADLHRFFQWASSVGLPPLAAKRAHIDLYRAWMDEGGLAASTVDRRLSTVCGNNRFAHIDGRISANPALYVRRPRVHAVPTSRLSAPSAGIARCGSSARATSLPPCHSCRAPAALSTCSSASASMARSCCETTVSASTSRRLRRRRVRHQRLRPRRSPHSSVRRDRTPRRAVRGPGERQAHQPAHPGIAACDGPASGMFAPTDAEWVGGDGASAQAMA
jgi:Phage integrase, N-terminal SAM-like domain